MRFLTILAQSFISLSFITRPWLCIFQRNFIAPLQLSFNF
jgi:hypothetical protein